MPYRPPAPLLNVDAGEAPDEPAALLGLADVVNVACGGHAGDEASMARTLALAPGRVAAHPSFPDREGFGRRRMALVPAALAASVAEQCAALRRVAEGLGRQVEAVKPHGALYHAADADPDLARAVVEGAVAALGPVVVVGPAGGALQAAAGGLGYWREGFADRGMGPDGRLLPRGTPGALLTDPMAAAAQARRLREGGACETVCVHGDTPGALAVARAVAGALREGEEGEPVLLAGWGLGAADARALGLDPEVADVVVTDLEAGLWLRPGARLGDVLARLGAEAPGPAREVRIAVRYDGPDLAAVAAELGLSPAGLVAAHAAADWSVGFLGFLPGFAYLDAPAEGPGAWGRSVARLPAPRARVPAGAVGLAGARSGVYPSASPGGWRLVGEAVGFAAFDPARGAALRPGDRVRFVPVDG